MSGSRVVAFLTQHGKEQLLQSVCGPALGWQVQRVAGYDTDQLGSFTRVHARAGSQREAARRKAELACELSGLPRGLGSEGAFAPDPYVGLSPWNLEILCYLDREAGLEIYASADSLEVSCAQAWVSDLAGVHRFSEAQGFPAQGLLLADRRLEPGRAGEARILQDLPDLESLTQSALQLLAEGGGLWLETDQRAHRNPRRQRVILRAAEDLVRRLQARCPSCGTPDFGVKRRVPGLPCGACGMPTEAILWDIHGCAHCGHEQRVQRAEFADPAQCGLCNP